MDLYISTQGAAIGRKRNSFLISTLEKNITLSPEKLDSIILESNSSISTGAIKLAIDYNITIMISDRFGNLLGHFSKLNYSKAARLRKKQYELFVSKKGIEYILEPIPTKNINAQNFQSKTAGAKVIADNGVDKNLVPVLLYKNPNKRGRNFIKFDGIEVEGGVISLIDAKTDVPYWSKVGMEKIKGTLGRISEAKKQNPGIKVIYEFPNETAAGHLRSWIDKNNFYDGIVEIKVRK